MGDYDAFSEAARKIISREIGKSAPKNKYSAEKTEIDGHKFDSRKEAQRYAELRLLEKAGVISELRTQVKYTLIPSQKRSDGKTERECYYLADFVYRQNGATVVEDVKGYRDPASAAYAKYTIKRKLMLERYGIEVREI